MKTLSKALILFVSILLVFFLTGCPQPTDDTDIEPNPTITIPATPTNPAATIESSTAITFNWNDVSTNETGYVFEYSTDDFVTTEYTTIPPLPAGSTSFPATGLSPSTEYKARVCAINSAGNSDFLEITAITNPTPTTIPAMPSNLRLTAMSGSIYATWDDNADNEDGFIIQWDTNSDFSNYDDNDTEANKTNLWITGLSIGTYYVRVLATNSAGGSEWCEIMGVALIIPDGSFLIDDDEIYSYSTSVILNININNITEMRFTNYEGNYDYIDWEPYSTSKTWTLTNGDGGKTVYAEFRTTEGTIISKSDSVILDTTPPDISSVIINNGAESTNSTLVSIQLAINQLGYEMSYKFYFDGAWSNWINYQTQFNLTIPSGDGPKYVYIKLKDVAGNESEEKYDTIILDTVPPDIENFTIFDGDVSDHAYSTSLMLQYSVPDAEYMRFSSSSADLDSKLWMVYDELGHEWNLSNPVENTNIVVYAEFKDNAGNIASTNDSIYYDKYRILKVTATSLHVENDSDSSGPGEIYWQLNGRYNVSNSIFVISLKTKEEAVSLNDNETYILLDESNTFTMLNEPDSNLGISFQMYDDDGSSYDYTQIIFIHYDAIDNWGAGDHQIYASGGTNGLAGTMYFTIEEID